MRNDAKGDGVLCGLAAPRAEEQSHTQSRKDERGREFIAWNAEAAEKSGHKKHKTHNICKSGAVGEH